MSKLTNREFYNLRGGLTRERVEWLLDLEEAAREVSDPSKSGDYDSQEFDSAIYALTETLQRVPLE